MLAFFDTNIYIDELTGTLPALTCQTWRSHYIIRLCPIVYHELLRGTRNPELIYEIRDHTIALNTPTFAMWEHAAQLLRDYVKRFGPQGNPYRLQNDILIALTARHTGALLITKDQDFDQLAQLVLFPYLRYQG